MSNAVRSLHLVYPDENGDLRKELEVNKYW